MTETVIYCIIITNTLHWITLTADATSVHIYLAELLTGIQPSTQSKIVGVGCLFLPFPSHVNEEQLHFRLYPLCSLFKAT